MPPRYVTIRPRAVVRRWLEDDGVPTDWAAGASHGQTVIESEVSAAPTGLFDIDGNELARITKAPLGFDLGSR